MKKILLKKVLLFAALLGLSSFFLTGCKKDGLVTKSKSTDSTVTTLATGSSYYYVTPDNSGNLYALGYGGTTIYKYNGNSGKTAFYTLPVTTSGDSTVVNKLECLTSDSLGNIYTVSVNNAGVANVLKITQSGSASTIFSSINANNGHQIQSIASNNGNFYFSDNTGIYKIAPGSSPELLVQSTSADFAVDKNGNVLYFTYAQSNNNGEISLNQITPQGGQSVLVPNLYNTGNSGGFGTDIVTDKFGNIYAYITTNPFALLKINTALKITTVMTGTLGNVDGPFGVAEIGGTSDMVADPTGNIYFSQINNDGSESYLRKITF
jgi:hypothetical protein